MANFFKLLFLENEMAGYAYVEPFAGGASVALSLLFEEYASEIHINDVDRGIFAFWHAVLNQSEELSQRISDTAINMQEWQRQRAVQETTDPDPLDLAFSTFFLNRANRSGIISGGVIGGQDQEGHWKLDARFNKQDLIRRVGKIARYSSRIRLTQLDAAELLREYLAVDGRQCFLYLDPPYYVKGEGLYRNFYEHKDHEKIASLVRQLSLPWVVTYDYRPEITTLYSGIDSVRYSLSYSAATRYCGKEILFASPGLNLPESTSPANLKAEFVDAAVVEAYSLT